MSEPVKPALTVEEWKLQSVTRMRGEEEYTFGLTPNGLGFRHEAPGYVNVSEVLNEDRLAVAALALYGYFTREDVTLLRTAFPGEMNPDGRYSRLADRIEPLLPQEEK